MRKGAPRSQRSSDAESSAWKGIAAKKKKNWPTSRYAWQSAVISETSSPSVKRLSASRVSVDGLR